MADVTIVKESIIYLDILGEPTTKADAVRGETVMTLSDGREVHALFDLKSAPKR